MPMDTSHSLTPWKLRHWTNTDRPRSMLISPAVFGSNPISDLASGVSG